MKKLIYSVLLGSVLVLSACGGGEDEPEKVGIEKLVDQKCATCHGGNLQGDYGPKIDNIGAKLSEDEILDIIVNGKGQMPGVLKGEEAKEVAEWFANKK
ncbi:cytochrome c [Bacillus spongiae]|uniref:Cytochrome c n=1 Tax=Bacillus spongiae TaxID=2683610 RepID=A0ABU8HEN5_9BACI